MKNEASIERLREVLTVRDGRLFWLVDRKVGRGAGRVHVRAGDEAGCMAKTGYRVFRLDGRLYLTHRVIWAITHGRWPAEVDHINRCRADNRPENLREATSSQNKANRGATVRNTSGHKGVSWNPKLGKWAAHIGVNGQNRYLGLFESVALAGAAYRAAAEQAFGEFAHA